jgi:threonine 3-dehydrogenase
MLRKGGRFSAFGVASESSVRIDYNNGIVFKGASIDGISGRRIFDTWYRVRNFLGSGRLDISPVITHLLPLEEYAKGFEVMINRPRTSAKVVLFPDAAELAAAKARRLPSPQLSPQGRGKGEGI